MKKIMRMTMAGFKKGTLRASLLTRRFSILLKRLRTAKMKTDRLTLFSIFKSLKLHRKSTRWMRNARNGTL